MTFGKERNLLQLVHEEIDSEREEPVKETLILQKILKFQLVLIQDHQRNNSE